MTDTIETRDGTVCRHCRLWPDLCTCNPNHPIREIFGAIRAATMRDRSIKQAGPVGGVDTSVRSGDGHIRTPAPTKATGAL